MTSYLFPEHNEQNAENGRKRKGQIQQALLEWIRTGKEINEEIFNKEIGGKSLTAAFSNLKRRGFIEPDEQVIRGDGKDSRGEYIPSYRLVRVPPAMNGTQSAPPDIEPDEPYEDVSFHDTPHVQSIGVHVANGKPMLFITFDDPRFKPLSHVMGDMEVSYLLSNLEPFRRKP
jgi:hypothetical protein